VLKDFPAKTSLMLGGTAMTPAQIDTQVQSYLATIAAADTAKAQYDAALVARKAIQVQARNFYLLLKKAVIAYFGVQAAQLTDFGLTPAKAKTAKSGGQLVVATAKALQTRAARGTKSKKAKAAINPSVVNPTVSVAPDGTLQAVPAGSTPAASGTANGNSTSSTSSTATSTAASGSGSVTPGSTNTTPSGS
jgi:hypothetical protein